MSAETLRRAAALMRERATATFAVVGANNTTLGPGIQGDVRVMAEHATAWTPEAAFALADWLDLVGQNDAHVGTNGHAAALAVARAYLGEPA